MEFKQFLTEQLLEEVSSDGYIGIGWVYKGKVLGLVETLEDGITFKKYYSPSYKSSKLLYYRHLKRVSRTRKNSLYVSSKISSIIQYLR